MSNDLKQTDISDFFDQYEKKTEDERIGYCIKFIIQKLAEQSLSAMVGAGFSKNANNDYPSWGALLVDAYKEMYSKEIKKKQKETAEKFKKRIISEIQNKGEPNIAGEYEAFKGKRESLDIYIEDQLAKIDPNKTQIETHKALLSLNWCDIITTNWDTLLEKARIENEYSIVKEAKELKIGNKKRIVKINGSLREEDEQKKLKYGFDGCFDHLYIITKFDFNNYTKNHEGFSNFMKVKMLENSFCLFGFSGNDFNFRYWMSELKRTMTKGGVTKNPNPIFLFYVDKEPIKKDLKQFYKNNYIIPISVDELYNDISGYKINTNPKELSPERTTIETPEKFIKIFEYLKQETEKEEKIVEKPTKKTYDSYSLISSFAFSNGNSISDDFIEKYNKIQIFNYSSVIFSDYSINKVQEHFQNLQRIKKEHFVFLYKWCLNNYYSLSNLFQEDVIEKLIEKYKKEKYYREDAYVFIELILKYYRETNQSEKFKAFCEISKSKKILNIINYEKGLLLKESFKYEELKTLLKQWTPEKLNSLFILRKISLILALDNPRNLSPILKDEVNKLFLNALKNCEEEQIKFFIICLYKYYLFSLNKINDFQLKDEFELLKENYEDPRGYFKFFIKNDEKKNVKPNVLTRYTITYTLFSREDDNSEYVSLLRFFNFFEYTGLTMRGFVYEYEMINLISSIKKWKHLLRKSLVSCFPFFGDSSEEYFLRAAVPLILRNFDAKENETIFFATFAILEYKTSHNQDIRSDIYLLSEIARRVNKGVAKKLYDYFLKEILSSKKRSNQIINGIKRGHIWGIKEPFLQCIEEIDDEKTVVQLLKWIMQEYIKEEKKRLIEPHNLSSEFLSYYKKMIINRTDIDEILKGFFYLKDIKALLSEDLKQTKQLSLYAYKYIDEDVKKELLTYYETAYSIQTDPFFITFFKSEKIKYQILEEIEKNDVLVIDSRNYPVENFILALNQVGLLDIKDKIRVSNIFSKNYERIKNCPHFITNKKNYIKEFFIMLETILTQEEKTSIYKTRKIYEMVKNEFLESIKDFYNFKWLYSSPSQEFKQNFSNALAYFSYLREASKYLYVFNAALTKILVQDNSDFEAVIGQFEKCYTTYEDGLFINEETTIILLQIMNKFKMTIPDCYDDLFIKKEMKLLADKMAEEKIEDEIINYWQKISIK